MSSSLPPKENNLFKRILKSYEQKQYKNGLKYAKQILSNPKLVEHGETLAMKGLMHNCLGQKGDAYEHVKKGLKNNLQSYICWHVYGLLQRSDRKYDEAIKAYRNALKWDKENIQIMRDLSLLQLQMRDLDGFNETRSRLFFLRPQNRNNWMGYIISLHLVGNFALVRQMLQQFKALPSFIETDFERTEVFLYEAEIIRESGDPRSCLKFLIENDHKIFDKLSLNEAKASLHSEFKDREIAIDLYHDLIKRNPGNVLYFDCMLNNLNSEEEKLQFLADKNILFPKSECPKRLSLDVASGIEFDRLLGIYMRQKISKGVPPLFLNMKSLYNNSVKVSQVQTVALRFYNNLKSVRKYELTDDQEEPPTTLLWIMYFLAQHFDRIGQCDVALKYIDTALEHTPTLIELYLLKGSILKHIGDFLSAAACLEEAQLLDTADRYVNCKCAKMTLRCNRIENAELICSRFTREATATLTYLNEMQCMWFETEMAYAYFRLNLLGDCLKKCLEVDRHFNEFVEDQFDFHSYCVRRLCSRAYVNFLREIDNVKEHRYFRQAAVIAIKVYLRLHKFPFDKMQDEVEIDKSKMTLNEIRKLKKEQKRKDKEVELKRVEEEKKKKKKSEDNDPDAFKQAELVPDKLLLCDSPLEEASKFVKSLRLFSPKYLETHILSFDVHRELRKPLLMIQSYKKIQSLSPDNPFLHYCKVCLKMVALSECHDAVNEVFRGEIVDIPDDLREFTESFLNSNCNSLPHVLEASKSMYFLDNSSQGEALDLLIKSLDNPTALWTEARDVYEAIQLCQLGLLSENDLTLFRNKCVERFPLVSYFKDLSIANKDRKCLVNGSESFEDVRSLTRLEGASEGAL